MSIARTIRFIVIAATAVALSGCIRFASPVALPVADASTGFELADVTGDGTADVLIGTTSGLARYEYCGVGCLQPKEEVLGERPGLVADFNNDEKDDVISRSGSSAKILFGSATGLSANDAVTVPPVDGKAIAKTGDFNGDGNVDLVWSGVVFTYYVEYVVRLGDGQGGFTASSMSALSGPLNAGRNQVEVADIDGDGRDDLVSSWLGEIAVVRFGGLSGCFANSTCPAFTTPNSGSLFTAGDIDDDGRADLARYDSNANAIAFLRSTGTAFAAFPYQQTIAVPFSGTQIQMSLRDVDGDDAVDFLLNDWVNPRTWWSGTNDGGFPYQAQTDVPVQLSGCRDCMGDINGDDRLDALFLNQLWINTST